MPSTVRYTSSLLRNVSSFRCDSSHTDDKTSRISASYSVRAVGYTLIRTRVVLKSLCTVYI